MLSTTCHWPLASCCCLFLLGVGVLATTAKTSQVADDPPVILPTCDAFRDPSDAADSHACYCEVTSTHPVVLARGCASFAQWGLTGALWIRSGVARAAKASLRASTGFWRCENAPPPSLHAVEPALHRMGATQAVHGAPARSYREPFLSAATCLMGKPPMTGSRAARATLLSPAPSPAPQATSSAQTQCVCDPRTPPHRRSICTTSVRTSGASDARPRSKTCARGS